MNPVGTLSNSLHWFRTSVNSFTTSKLFPSTKSGRWIRFSLNHRNKGFSNRNPNYEALGKPENSGDSDSRSPFVTQPAETTLDLDRLIGSLERQPRVSLGKAFLRAWVDHMAEYPEKLKNVQWQEIIRKCKEIDRSMGDVNFSGILFSCCEKPRHILVADSYLKWDKNPSLSVLTLYVRALADASQEVNESQILEVYEMIKSKNRGVWDFQSGERVIRGLVRTSKWKESLEIIKEMEFGGLVPSSIYSYVAAEAFNRKDFELGWSILNQLKYRSISELVFIECVRNMEETEQEVVKLLEFMDLYEHYPTANIILALQHFFENSLGYTGKSSGITSNGSCLNCKNELEQNKLAADEYKCLVEAFMDKVLQDEDIFINTSPEELRIYRNFIAAKGPFDFVLDGLNVAFARGKVSPIDAVKNLEGLVSQLSSQGHRVLVIGRKHMARWPRPNMQRIQSRAYVHLINNSSNDDPFILYATLKSGSHAKFISKDMMRNHTFRLQDPALARLFKRWRLAHQLTIENRGSHLRLIPFTSTLPIPQKNLKTGYWHIPYDLEKLLSPYDLPSNWLCLRPGDKNK